jgi:hypothetical protein
LSDVSVPAPGGATSTQGYEPKSALKSVALSLFINAVLPFVIYKVLEPHFPSGSVMPLLYASSFPVLDLAFGLIRKRSVDAIAVIALFGIAWSVSSVLFAGEIRLAMIYGATQGYVIAAVFFGSMLIGKPVLFFIFRQFAAGNDLDARVRFGVVNEKDGWRTIRIATVVWTVGILVLTTISLTLARLLPPATYILTNNVINIAVNIALVIWSIRFVRPRLTRVGMQMQASGASNAAS